MKKADLKPGVYVVNYRGGNTFKVHNILNEDGKDVVWLVDTITEKVSQQGYNTVIKNYKLATQQKVEDSSITEEEIVNTNNDKDIIKEDKFKDLESLEPEVMTVPEDKERPNLQAIFNKNKEMELNGGNNMKKETKKKKSPVKNESKTTKKVKGVKSTEQKKSKVDKTPKSQKTSKASDESVNILQDILDSLIESKSIPSMDSKKARRLIRSRCPELKELTVDGSKWEFFDDNLEEATEMLKINLGK